MYQIANAVFAAFDREVVVAYGVDARITVGGVPVTWSGGGPGAFCEGVCVGAGAGDVWAVGAGPDAAIETSPGVPAVFRAQSGVVLLLN